MNNQNNQRDGNAVFARKLTRGPSKDGSKQLTKIFLNNETVEAIIAGLQDSLTKAQDGVSLTIIEGTGANGKPFTMVASDGLEDRGYQRPEGQQGGYQGQKKPYNPPAAQQAGGYKPKTPGYTPKGRN
jgi:hypothetical protein